MDHQHHTDHDITGGSPAQGVEVLGWVVFDVLVVLALTAAAASYAVALWAARDRSPVPGHRTMFWYAGLGCAGAGLIGPVATAAFWVVLVGREGSRALLGKETSRAALRGLLSPRYLRQTPGPHSIAPVTASA